MSKTSTDPIADMLTRIRNAIMVRKAVVVMPHSKVKESVAKLLKKSNFLDDVRLQDAPTGKELKLTINAEGSGPRITEIVRLSTPGRRHYAGVNKIPTVKRGRGVVIVSTSQGMMTGDDAKKIGVGGELICKVY